MATDPDPFQRQEQMFPTLTAAQIARIAAYGQRLDVRRGDVLFAQGEHNARFFVVIAGSIDVAIESLDGVKTQVIVHGPGQFSGEWSALSAERNAATGRALEDGEVIALDHAALRRLVQTDSELSEILMRAFILRRMGLIARNRSDLVLVGSNHSADTLRIKGFLTRNGQAYTYLDAEHEPGMEGLLDRFHISVDDLPVVLCRSGTIVKNPSNQYLAEGIGLSVEIDPQAVRDVVIVGAGPAGLGAAVYAASEGLDVVVMETSAPGGQAGSSSKIENYLGFPTGISGQALAGRAFAQAQKFGAEVDIARSAARLDCESRPYGVKVVGGGVVRTRAVIIATGAEYRKLPLANLERFEGVGVHYGATYLEAQLCEGQEVIVVGGGNSAGQAAVFLAGVVPHVHLLVRAPGLAESMSRYLIRRIEQTPNITLRTHTQIEALEGDDRLQRVRWHNQEIGETTTRNIGHVFMMTGARPNTEWVRGCVALDDKGFIKTGPDLSADDRERWPLERRPYLLETSQPGVFAVGDVRSGSTKRVAAAVGEGSICVQLVHKVLQE